MKMATKRKKLINDKEEDSHDRDRKLFSSSLKSLSLNEVRERRRTDYNNRMAELNFQLVQFSKRALKVGPSDVPYVGLVHNYIHQADALKERFCRIPGELASFGDGQGGQLGCGSNVNESRIPKVVQNLRGLGIVRVSCGGYHTLALSEMGNVYSFGCNDEGSLGAQPVDEGYLPVEVTDFQLSSYDHKLQFKRPKQSQKPEIFKVVAGETVSLALTCDGDVFMWGNYKDNEGRKFRHLPPPDDYRTPTGFKNMNLLEEDQEPAFFHPPMGNQDWPLHLYQMPLPVKAVSAGEGVCAAILEDDSIVTWGLGKSGELGRKVPELDKKTSNAVISNQFLTPMPPNWAGLNTKRTVTSISCGGFHLIVVSRAGGGNTDVHSCGLNNFGQLGLGDYENRDELTKIEFFVEECINHVEAGYQFSCFLDITGKKLYSCGRGDYGQLGITLEQPELRFNQNKPVRVPLIHNIDLSTISDPKANCISEKDIIEEDQPRIVQISCGSTHALVLTEAGDVYSWGFGTVGACGHGKAETDVLRPKKLETNLKNTNGANDVVQFVSGGGQHSAIVVSSKTNSFEV